MKTEIKYESHELTVIRIKQSQTATVFCRFCKQKTTHLTIVRAAAALGISETAVFRLAEGDAVHSCEAASGALLVCGNSVSALTKKNFTKGENYVD